jgi:hypothetical protein
LITQANAQHLVKIGAADWLIVDYYPTGNLGEFIPVRNYDIVLTDIRHRVHRVDTFAEADIERAFIDSIDDNNKYIQLLEEYHRIILEARKKLIVDFRPDPDDLDPPGVFPNRSLFYWPHEGFRKYAGKNVIQKTGEQCQTT